jgi:hypothetical protein
MQNDWKLEFICEIWFFFTLVHILTFSVGAKHQSINQSINQLTFCMLLVFIYEAHLMPLAHKYMTADLLGLPERDLPEAKAPI